MTDTQRDTPTLQSLLADNSSGKITAQMLRDFVVSTFGGYGWMYVENGAAAQTVNIVASKLTSFAANGAPSNGPVPSFSSAQITTPVAGDYWVDAEFSFSGTASRTIQFQLRKNGVAISGARCRGKLNASGDLSEVSFVGLVTCAANDALTVYAAADVDGTSITVVDAALSIRRVG